MSSSESGFASHVLLAWQQKLSINDLLNCASQLEAAQQFELAAVSLSDVALAQSDGLQSFRVLQPGRGAVECRRPRRREERVSPGHRAVADVRPAALQPRLGVRPARSARRGRRRMDMGRRPYVRRQSRRAGDPPARAEQPRTRSRSAAAVRPGARPPHREPAHGAEPAGRAASLGLPAREAMRVAGVCGHRRRRSRTDAQVDLGTRDDRAVGRPRSATRRREALTSPTSSERMCRRSPRRKLMGTRRSASRICRRISACIRSAC